VYFVLCLLVVICNVYLCILLLLNTHTHTHTHRSMEESIAETTTEKLKDQLFTMISARCVCVYIYMCVYIYVCVFVSLLDMFVC